MQGQVIGLESNVGTGGSHLHFEVVVPEVPVNPPLIDNEGTIEGVRRTPRFCDGVELWLGDTYTAGDCPI